MRGGRRTAEGKVKVNENGEYYIERRGRKPGKFGARGGRGGAQAGRILQRRTSARTSAKRGVYVNSDGNKLEEIYERYANRRNIIFKANCPSKAPKGRASVRFVEQVRYKNIRYKTGDIVAVTDKEDGLQYFGQIRGLIVDPMMNMFAALTWLIPRKSAVDPHSFDPEHFAHGLVDATNHPIQICEWVSSRPALPPYQKLWTARRAAASCSRANAENRWKELLTVANQELLKADERPLIDLVVTKNLEAERI